VVHQGNLHVFLGSGSGQGLLMPDYCPDSAALYGKRWDELGRFGISFPFDFIGLLAK
jgi:hypothetical protein